MTHHPSQQIVSRREWLKASTFGVGSLVLTGLTPNESAASLLSPRPPHFAPKAKRVIFIFINGGPSQFESFDYKPKLKANSGKIGTKKGKLLGPLCKFAQRGKSGVWVSEVFPHLADQADHLCILNAMNAPSSAHPIAVPMLHTGDFQFIRPSVGAWVLYGLGSENQALPGFFTIKPTRIFGGPANYGSAFLPSTYQATRIGWGWPSERWGTIRNLTASHGLTAEAAKQSLALAQTMNQKLLSQTPDVGGVIDSLNLSERMQYAVPEVMDIGRESKSTQAMYGIGKSPTNDFGRQCLLARRLAESGVRFVQVNTAGWDHHFGTKNRFKRKAEQIDQPIAALLADLAQRGLLHETLVLWTGEFGRQPETQIIKGQAAPGRDHNAAGFTAWLAGGGVRAGYHHGTTDELGYKAVEGQVHLHDLHATMLHLLGLDHKKLVFRYGGRDFRLTDVHGKVVHDIIA